MNIDAVTIDRGDMRKLLSAANPDTCLLYIYLKSGNDMERAEEELNIPANRLSCAGATLRQLGLWGMEKEKGVLPMSGERPNYTERDVENAYNSNWEFQALCGEVQRLLGRPIHTEDYKILLGFIHYLGLPLDVISVLVSFCKDRARQRGNLRGPSLRTIEKEAYAWAERGIDTMEEAAAFITAQNLQHSQMSHLMHLLQIRGRTLTPPEERYANAWLEMGFDDEVIAMAYERTCLNTGGLSWAYMNKILQRWHDAGFKTADAVRNRDRKPTAGPIAGQRQLDADEQAAIARMLREG